MYIRKNTAWKGSFVLSLRGRLTFSNIIADLPGMFYSKVDEKITGKRMVVPLKFISSVLCIWTQRNVRKS